MLDSHVKLVNQYKDNEKKINKAQNVTLLREVLVVGIVVGMKAIQNTASLQLNLCATSLVLLLLCWHFWGFYPRRAAYAHSTNIILKGLELEQSNPYLNQSFFRNYLRDFNVLGQIINMAVLDLILLYFFSVSYTQVLKKINPEAITILIKFRPITSAIINLSLGWAYYQAIKPLVHLKRSIKPDLT